MPWIGITAARRETNGQTYLRSKAWQWMTQEWEWIRVKVKRLAVWKWINSSVLCWTSKDAIYTDCGLLTSLKWTGHTRLWNAEIHWTVSGNIEDFFCAVLCILLKCWEWRLGASSVGKGLPAQVWRQDLRSPSLVWKPNKAERREPQCWCGYRSLLPA